jgi:hypothetical protein
VSNQFDVEDEKAEAQEPELELDKITNAATLKAVIARRNNQAAANPSARKVEAAAKTSRNVAKWAGWHAKSGERSCAVCQLKTETLEEVKHAYINGVSYMAIKKATGVGRHHLTAHATAEAWDWERAKCTERALALLQERGLEYVRNNPDAVDGELLLKVVQHIDKREGKVVERVQNQTNVAIQFVGMPTPISPAKNAREQIADTTKPLTLSPASIEVLDEGNLPAEAVQVSPDGADLPTDE